MMDSQDVPTHVRYILSRLLPMDPSTRLENLLRRDRIIVLGGLTGLALLAAFYTASIGPVSSHGIVAPETLAPPQLHSWHTGDLSLLFLMWILMMVAMSQTTPFRARRRVRWRRCRKQLGERGR